MKSWQKYLLLSFTLLAFQSSFAQDDEDSAPKEAPFVEEDSEFEDVSSEEEPVDSLTIEDEVQSADVIEKQETKKEAVNLNQQADPDKKLEEELSLDPETPVEAEAETKLELEPEPEVEFETPVEAPVVEVKPSPALQQSPMVQKSAKGGVEYIHHPQAAQGLLAITKEGAYIYKTKEERTYNQTGAFRMGMINPPRISSSNENINFNNMYSSSQQPIVSFDFEWQPFTTYGKLGLQAGFGFLVAYGQGRFVGGSMDGQEAKEEYTFIAVPLNLGVVYRLEWMSRQWFAPYISGGGTYIGVAEIRDDGASPKAVGTPGAYGGGGILFNISALDRETAFTLSSEYGISNLWVSADFKQLQTFSEDLDFSSSILGAGIVVDY
ncbi:hypothetical protein [Bdellovibrio reynosensis]|uniref:Outer membrane protein beta-barrel domain-containing protein n=1 Tax=Bdellovibrio reynosensis TaxID=2835041 RepID=A0ABY4C7T4_9BACT|nr:hypothetical protein [Bdellovibrio reynosensis]UOE99971.1 hypothetical protein MNR06_09695 [Bdellovibrio reynosensis]